MKVVENNQVNSKTFGQLPQGYIFKLKSDIPSSTVFMPLARNYHLGQYDREKYDAIDIRTGELYWFDDNEPVIPFPNSYLTVK